MADVISVSCSRRVLDVSDGFHEPGGVRYQLLLCLLACWIVVFLALAKGIRVSGKVNAQKPLLSLRR